MAEDKKIVIDTVIKSSESAKSLRDLTKSMKDLVQAQSEVAYGSKEWKKISAAINETEGKIGDMNDRLKTLSGSGLERATASVGLLGEGFRNFDFGKITEGFKAVGASLTAIPLFLIVEGITKLIENWDELGKGNGIIAKSIQALNVIFEEITDTIYKFTDAIGLTNSELDKLGETISENAAKSQEALSAQNAEFDRQIRVAKAAGKSTVELEKQKQQAIIDTNVTIARQIEAFVRAGGELDEERRKLLTASLEAIKEAKVKEYEIETTDLKAKNELYKKHLEERKKLEEEFLAADRALNAENDQLKIQNLTNFNNMVKAQNEELKQATIVDTFDLDGLREQANQQEIRRNAERVAFLQDLDYQAAQKQISIASDTANALNSLSDLVFTLKAAKAKKSGIEDEKLAKRQFQITKALQLTLAGVDAAKAITTSLASAPLFVGTVPNPAGIASLAAAITSSAAAIATIASKRFEPSGGGSTSVPSIPSPSLGGGGGGSTNTAPSTQVQPFTRLDEEGNVTGKSTTVKAYVVESEMSESQKRVGRLENQASFG